MELEKLIEKFKNEQLEEPTQYVEPAENPFDAPIPGQSLTDEPGNYPWEHPPQNFSYDGLTVLYDHLIQFEEDTDQELEFDPIAYCCEYTEFDSFKEVQLNYDVKTIKELEDKTTVLKIPNSEKLIVQNY